jgi:hypothetical protein
VSSAAGSGSDSPFAGYDVLSVHGTHDDQSDGVFHFLEEYAESVCIEEQSGGDASWSEDLVESSIDEDSESTSSSMVGITPKELESFNELIKFDHMYFRQPSKEADTRSCEKPLDQSETGSCEVISELICKDETAELASDEELNLSSFSESDLAQLTNCLDWLIDSSSDMLTECKVNELKCRDDASCLVPYDIESACLQEHIDSLTPFTDDSFISTIHFDYSFDKHNSNNSTCDSNSEKSSMQNLVKNSELDFKNNYDHLASSIAEEKNSSKTDSFSPDHLVSCSSPCSSSGCESDFSSSTYEDEHFSFTTDIGLMDFSDEPFTELFPALY